MNRLMTRHRSRHDGIEPQRTPWPRFWGAGVGGYEVTRASVRKMIVRYAAPRPWRVLGLNQRMWPACVFVATGFFNLSCLVSPSGLQAVSANARAVNDPRRRQVSFLLLVLRKGQGDRNRLANWPGQSDLRADARRRLTGRRAQP